MPDSCWLILCVFVARTTMACQFQTVASTAPFLVGSFAIDYAQPGVLIGLFRLPGIFTAFRGSPARRVIPATAALFAAAIIKHAGLAGFRLATL
jgi:hypothetical protein